MAADELAVVWAMLTEGGPGPLLGAGAYCPGTPDLLGCDPGRYI